MPEPSKHDTPPRDPQYPQGAEHENFSSEQFNYRPPKATGSFPAGDIYGQLPRSRAESFGRIVGFAVGGVLRFPRQAKSRLRQAGSTTRAQASAAVLEMMDTAAQRAEDLGRTTGATLSDWAHAARCKTARLENLAADRWQELSSSAKARVDAASRQAAEQWNQTQRAVTRLQEEDPARFLMMVAGAAFVIGAGVRVWRSNSNG
jgi:hypothetical protein